MPMDDSIPLASTCHESHRSQPDSHAVQPSEQNESMVDIRSRLENSFIHLMLIHDAALMCRLAASSQNADNDHSIANVSKRCATDPLFGQLETLTNIIERLGGRTELSDESGNE